MTDLDYENVIPIMHWSKVLMHGRIVILLLKFEMKDNNTRHEIEFLKFSVKFVPEGKSYNLLLILIKLIALIYLCNL